MYIILRILKLFYSTSGVKEKFFNVKTRLVLYEACFNIEELV